MSNLNLKIALYAGTGGRKTLQIASLIKQYGAENVGIISCESGLNTIASVIEPEFVRDADSFDDLKSAYAWAKTTFTKPGQWVCVDGGSRVLQWVSEEWWGGVYAAYEQVLNGMSPSQLPANLRKYAVYLAKDGVNNQGVWIRVGMECSRLFNGFVKLPSSMYWTFWEEQTNIDQYSKGLPWKPDTPGNGAFSAIKGAFDFIFRLSNDGDTCRATCDPNGKVSYAKCRDDWNVVRVPKSIERPDAADGFVLAEFVERLHGDGWGK